jgi:hypothetical protein
MTLDETFVADIDRKLIDRGMALHQRPFHVALAWFDLNRISGNLFADEVWQPLMEIYRRIYPSGDFSIPSLLVGAVAVRDQVYPARVQLAYGTVPIDPLKCIDIEASELEAHWKREPEQIWQAMYSVADLWDFAYSLQDLEHQNPDADTLWSNARSAIASTAQILRGPLNTEAAIQSSCLAAELSMKGVLAYLGWSEQRRRRFSHSLEGLAEAVVTERPSTRDDAFITACRSFPNYVQTRYEAHGLTRLQLVKLCLRSQYVAANAVRRISGRNLATQIEADPQTRPWVAP